MKKIFFFLAALMLTFTAHATIVECNPGTNNLAWYLTQGDTLVLADGLYEEAYSIDFTKPGVCVKAAEGAKPVIKLTDEWTVLDVQATTTFEGITFDAGNVAKYLIATTGVNPGTLTINNCEFCNWTYWALSNQFEETASIDSVIINNTLFHDGAQAAIYFGNKAPEGTHACNYFSLTNSTIYNVKSTEYAGIVHVSSNGEATGKQNTIIIDHVTMYNLDGADLGIIAARKTSDLTISNTIIANPAEGERASYVYGGVAENVIYYNVSQDGDLTYTNCLTDDPKFVDAANGDFALADGSPALGAATDGSDLGDPRWNVVVEPEPVEYTVTATVNPAETGTVEGAGKYVEGTTATLTATPAEGYQFVNWTVGEEVVSTENSYTFVVTADIALVANFELIPVVEPEKPEPTYTDNILNPYAFGLESVLSEDKATLTVTYRLNNTKATAVDVVVYNGEEVVKVVTGTKEMGKNTVEIPTEGLPAFKNLTWSVIVNGTSVAAPTQEGKSYSFWGPRGLAIDNDPESENFGRILVTESYHGAKDLANYVASGKGAGIYAFNPSFTTDSVVYTGGNDFTRILTTNGFQPWRVKISEDGRIFVSSLDLNGVAVWEVSNDLQTWTPVITGTNNATDYNMYDEDENFVAGPNCSMDVIGSGENLKLLLYSTNKNGIAYNQSGYRLDEYALGTAKTWIGTPKNILTGGKYGLVHTDVEFVYDGEGGYWFGGSRGGTAGEPNLVHINAEGVEDFRDETNKYYGGAGVLVQNGMLIKGKARTSASVGNFGIYTIGKDAEGKVTLTEKWTVASTLGRNHNAFALDYAGNLYVIGNSKEKIIAYALPYSGTVETPAASKYAFQLEGQLAETWDVTMTNLQVDDYGESIGLSADDKNTGLNVWLTIDTNGVIIPDYSSAAIVQGWSEIELPIVAGNLTKTYVDSLDTDVYSGLVIAEYEGGYLGLNLTMYYVPVPPVVVIVENATVDDQTENTGIMYMRGQWTDAESVVYPVTVEVPGFDATLAETVYDNVTVTVGGMEDEPWLGFGQGSATVTIANNLVTLKSVVSDWGGTVIDITISGNLPQGPGTALDNVDVEAKTIKMLKNGQLIIIKNGVQYNVQGQVIK